MEKPFSSTKRQRLNEDGAFDQVAQQSAYEYAPSSSTHPKVRYDVFINHRGPDVKDTLAQYIHDKLSDKGWVVFLDKEALAPGDSIPIEIQEAMNDAFLHIAIFSKTYAESAWCLAELSYMLKTRRRIIPIFYQVEPSDLRWADKEKGSYDDSFAQHERKGRYEAEKLREWKKALQTVSYIDGYVVKDEDWKPVLEGLPKRVVRAMKEARVAGDTNAPGLEEERPIVPRPSQGKYPNAVGLDKARDHVIGLLDLEGHSTRKIVVVYGVGGIGKTTLATAVFNTLNLTGYMQCRVVMEQNCSMRDIKSLQEQILLDLFNKNLRLRSCVEGQEQLSEAFREESTQPLFMFIDNALRGSDLAMLLPKDLSCLPGHSRMLITTRKLDETNIVLYPHIQRSAYLVECLPSLEAKKLVCKKVLGSVDASFDTEIDIDGLVKCCGGIPLVLEIVGSNLLSDGSNVSHWVNFLKETLQQGEGDLSESVVDCVYNCLLDSYKEAFLDVASFFSNEPRDYLAKIVGEVQMKGLEDAALVKTSGRRNIVTMHDIVRARGKWLSKSNRITDIESLKDALQDKQKLQQLKGIQIWEDRSEEIEFPAELLDLTSQTLRILRIDSTFGVKVKVEGRCKRSFESLRLLDLEEDEEINTCLSLGLNKSNTCLSMGLNKSNTCLSMGLNNLKRLAVCHNFRSPMTNYDCQIAKSLRVLNLKYSSTLPDSLGALSSLEELKLDECTFVSLPHSLGQLRLLHHLAIWHCEHLITVPESIGQLNSLRHLSLVFCKELTILPESLGNLFSLEELYLVECTKLEGLPQSVSQLSSLQKLYMMDCARLSRLPDKFGELKSLAAMRANGCSELEEKAMDALVELKSLMFLNIKKSPRLKARWEQVKKHHPLLVYSTDEDWRRIWQRQFREMMSWEFFHSGRRLMQLDGGGNLVEWIPSSSFVGGQAKVGVLFTMGDLCAPSNSEGLQTLREKCTELLRQDFHIIYVEVVGLGELSQQSEEHIRQALLSLSPGTIAWIAPHENMSQLFAYCAYKALRNGFNDKKRAFFCTEHQHVELTLALDALNTFLVEVKPVERATFFSPFIAKSPERQQAEHSLEGMYFGEGFHRLFSPLEALSTSASL